MPKSRGPLHDIFNRLPRQHLLAPFLDRRPRLDIDAKELEHPRHSERKVRQIGQCGAVFERNISLAGQRQPLFKYVPLLDGVFVQPVIQIKRVALVSSYSSKERRERPNRWKTLSKDDVCRKG